MAELDFNFNFAAGAVQSGQALRFRPRFNTDLYPRLVNTMPGQFVVPDISPMAPPNYPSFHQNWDADLRSYMYLDRFLEVVGAFAWRPAYRAVAIAGRTLPQNMGRAELNGEALQMLQLALERDDRFAEIIDQDDGEGAINYVLGMLKIDPERHPATNLMVRIARRIGEYVVMCLKGEFASPRPSQLCPAITPMIDPPVTPSFPAGHAVQAYLISYMIAYSLPRLPQHNLPAGLNLASGLLFDLAARVSENRVVAGIHYPVDIAAGRAVAIRCFTDVQQVPAIWTAAAAGGGLNWSVAAEFPQYS